MEIHFQIILMLVGFHFKCLVQQRITLFLHDNVDLL